MKTEWKREAQHIWLILSGEDLAPRESYQFRMLSENRIAGLLPCRFSQIDQQTKLYFDVSGRHALQDTMETAGLRSPLLEHLLTALIDICEKMQEYMLPADGLLLLPQRIFLNSEESQIGFCYYPGRAVPFQKQLQVFSESLLPHLEQQDKTAVVMGYSLYQRSMSEELPLDVMHDLLRKGRKTEKIPRPVTREELEQSVLLDSFFTDEEDEDTSFFGKVKGRVQGWFHKEREEEPEAYIPEQKPVENRARPASGTGRAGKENRMNSGPGPEAATTLLRGPLPGGGPERRWVLRIQDEDGSGKDIVLEKDRYIIGKCGAGADIELQSGAVSRRHARLQRAGNSYTVKDLYSRNGTLWEQNGQSRVLLPEQEVTLADGDRIRFADVFCVFREKTEPRFFS